MIRFDVLQPKTLDEAIGLLQEFGGGARPLAGGTDLIVALRFRKVRVQHLINLKQIPGLDEIVRHEGKGISIGAMAKVSAVGYSPIIQKDCSLLSDAALKLGSVQVRNLATIGGNLCNASPSADTAAPLLALGAEVRLVGPGGERRLPLEAFFTGPGTTALRTGELLTEIWIPEHPPGTGGWYIKHEMRKMMDCAIVGVAVVLTVNATQDRCEIGRIALGAVAPTPVRAQEAETMLCGQSLSDGVLSQVAEAALATARPINDVRGSADYRLDMVRTLVPRAVRQAWTNACAN